jgi:hypothetical protein
VKLKDGSVFRGTIVEFVPGDHVDLLLPSGETRRFAMKDVDYQGPAASPAPPPLPAPHPEARHEDREARHEDGTRGDSVTVHVASDQDDVALLVQTGQSEFEGVGWGYRSWVAVSGTSRNYAMICSAPCDAEVPLGTHRMALSLGGGRAAEADDTVRLTEPSTIQVHYESRLGMRVAGWLILGATVIAGSALVVDAMSKGTQDCSQGYCLSRQDVDKGEVAASIATAVVGGLLSVVLIRQKDQAHIEVVPQSASRLLRLPGSFEPVGVAHAEAPGLGVRLRF